MKFSRKTNKRSDIPSFREFLYQEKILRESGIIEDNEINYESKTSDISKERPSEKNSAKKQIYNDYNKNQIKAINLEKYKLIKENGLLKEELENYRKSLEKKELNDNIISQAHNKTIKKEFYCKNNEILNKFITKFNNNSYYRDITKYYYFKYEVDKGKFGHVFLARRNKDDKKLAIKLIQKKSRHPEEYKINRWEKDIFRLLQNIKVFINIK